MVIAEKTLGAVIGIVTVVDVDLPNDSHTFVLSDARFEIVSGVLALKAGQQVVFAVERAVVLTVTATDSFGNVLTKIFVLTVVEQIVPVTNHAPTDITLDNHSISDSELGGIVGNVSMSDPDMPDDTLVATVDDARFVVIPTGVATAQLRLKPNKFVSHLLEPTIPIVLTVTDAGGLTATRAYDLIVTDIAAPDLSNAIFVAPSSQGSGDGTSFANAYGLTSLNTVIGQARTSGKQVLLAAHLGTYGTYSSSPVVTLSTGGVAGTPVIIRGANAAGEEASISIVGNRAADASGQWTVGGTPGPQIIKFIAGADYLVFRNIDFTNCGNGCFYFTAPFSDIVLDTIVARNVRRFIENTFSSPATSATGNALRVRNVLVEGFSKGGLRLQYGTNNYSLENVVCDSLFQDGDNFAEAFDLGDTFNADIVDCHARNTKDVIPNQGPPQTFYNGDGFVAERGSDLRFLRCTSSGNSDAGFDLKTLNASLIECDSFGNKENYKFWSTATMLRCRGADPLNRWNDATWVASQIELDATSGIPAVVTATDCVFVDSSPDTKAVFLFGESGSSSITTVNTSIQKHASVPYTFDYHSGGVANLDNKTGPVFTVDPVISDVAAAGAISLVTPGTVTGGVEDAFQWFRRLAAESFAVHIDDAVSAGYTATADDVGNYLTCRQFTVDANGYMTEAVSNEIGPIAASSLVNLVAPSLGGIPYQGGVQIIDVGSWSGIPAPTFTVQVKMDGVVVQDQPWPAVLGYTATPADVGKARTLTVFATNSSGTVSASGGDAAVIGAQLGAAYIRPAAHGTGAADSWANATTWGQLDSVIAACAPGATVHVASFTYDGEFFIASGVPIPTVRHAGVGPDSIIKLVNDVEARMGQVAVFDAAADMSGFITVKGSNLDLSDGLTRFRSNRHAWTRPFEGQLIDPFTTQAGSAVVTVHIPDHKLVGTGQTVGFWGQTAVGGITISPASGSSSIYYPITQILGPDDFTITHSAPAVSGATGGGTVNYEAVTSVVGWAAGWQCLKLAAGANNLRFSYLGFQDVLSGIHVNLSTYPQNVMIDNCYFYNVFHAVEQDFNSSVLGALTDFYYKDNTAIGFSKTAFRVRGDSIRVVFDGLTADAGRQNGDNWSTGIEFNQNASYCAVYNFDISCCHQGLANSAFWNADGISGESTNSHIIIQDGVLHGCTDGGYDSKADWQIVRRVHSYDNKECLKLWTFYHNTVLVDDCDLNDARKRGGTWGQALLESTGGSVDVATIGDFTVKNTRCSYVSSGLMWMPEDSTFHHNTVVRLMDNVLTNTTATPPASALVLTGSAADVTPPTITSANAVNAYNNARLVFPLTANEGVTWSVVGGADAALFNPCDSAGTIVGQGQYLRMDKQTFSGVDDTREVTIRATDVNHNTTDQTITVTVLSSAPPYTFQCLFEGANNANTPITDDAGGKTITFAGNAKLTTTSPIEGTSSLLCDGVDDRAISAAHADFHFGVEFSVLVEFNSTVLTSAQLFGQYAIGQRNWRLATSSTGAVTFQYSLDGTNILQVRSADSIMTTGVDHELALDRDEAGVMRLYFDGVMVATATSSALFKVSTASLTMGTTADGTPTEDFNGRIDNARIWKGYAFCASDSGYTP